MSGQKMSVKWRMERKLDGNNEMVKNSQAAHTINSEENILGVTRTHK